MTGTYDILSNGQSVGTAKVEQQGLYYRISCLCRDTFRPHSRVFIILSAGKIDLGLCVPLEKGYGLHTHIPIKRLKEQVPVFCLVEMQQQASATFIPVQVDKPFYFIGKLKDARFAIRNGKTGIQIEEG